MPSNYPDSFSSASLPASPPLLPPLTPTTSIEDADHLQHHPGDEKQAQSVRSRSHNRSRSRSRSDSSRALSTRVRDVLETYSHIARGLSLESRPTSTSQFAAGALLWRDFSTNDYDCLQSVLESPPARYTRAAAWRRTKAREDYNDKKSVLRLRMVSWVHERLGQVFGQDLLSELKQTLRQHPQDSVSRWADRFVPNGGAIIHLRNPEQRRSPDFSIAIESLSDDEEDEEDRQNQATRNADNDALRYAEESASVTAASGEPLATEPQPEPTSFEPQPAFPAAVIEAGFSNQAESEFELEAYMDGSKGHIRTVIYLEIEYRDLQSRKTNPTLPPLRITLLRLRPSESDPTQRTLHTTYDVIHPAGESQESRLSLNLDDFLADIPSPNSAINIDYARVRRSFRKAWSAQLEVDRDVAPKSPTSYQYKRKRSENSDLDVGIGSTEDGKRQKTKGKARERKQDGQPAASTMSSGEQQNTRRTSLRLKKKVSADAG